MQIQAIKVQRLYLQVAEQLRELISAGTFETGQRLPSERDLAGQFGVSRPTIREAMIALEIAGMVEVRSGSGVYVRERGDGPAQLPDAQSPGPFEILEARRLIEGEACALAAERIDDGQLARLRQLVAEMAEENRREEITEQADEKFHCLVAQASGNSALAAMVSWLWRLRNESAISTHFHRRVREEGQRPIVADHQAILDALERRDKAAARDAMTRHLQRVIDHLMDVL